MRHGNSSKEKKIIIKASYTTCVSWLEFRPNMMGMESAEGPKRQSLARKLIMKHRIRLREHAPRLMHSVLTLLRLNRAPRASRRPGCRKPACFQAVAKWRRVVSALQPCCFVALSHARDTSGARDEMMCEIPHSAIPPFQAIFASRTKGRSSPKGCYRLSEENALDDLEYQATENDEGQKD